MRDVDKVVATMLQWYPYQEFSDARLSWQFMEVLEHKEIATDMMDNVELAPVVLDLDIEAAVWKELNDIDVEECAEEFEINLPRLIEDDWSMTMTEVEEVPCEEWLVRELSEMGMEVKKQHGDNDIEMGNTAIWAATSKGGGGRGLESVCEIVMAGRIRGKLPVESENSYQQSSDNP